MLDVVCTRNDLPSPTIDVIDIGLADHRLLLWASQLCRPVLIYTSTEPDLQPEDTTLDVAKPNDDQHEETSLAAIEANVNQFL